MNHLPPRHPPPRSQPPTSNRHKRPGVVSHRHRRLVDPDPVPSATRAGPPSPAVHPVHDLRCPARIAADHMVRGPRVARGLEASRARASLERHAIPLSPGGHAHRSDAGGAGVAEHRVAAIGPGRLTRPAVALEVRGARRVQPEDRIGPCCDRPAPARVADEQAANSRALGVARTPHPHAAGREVLERRCGEARGRAARLHGVLTGRRRERGTEPCPTDRQDHQRATSELPCHSTLHSLTRPTPRRVLSPSRSRAMEVRPPRLRRGTPQIPGGTVLLLTQTGAR